MQLKERESEEEEDVPLIVARPKQLTVRKWISLQPFLEASNSQTTFTKASST